MKCRFGELHSVSSVSLDYDINLNPKLFSYDDLNFSNLMNKLFFFNRAQPLPHPSQTGATVPSRGFVFGLLQKLLFEGKVPWQQKVWTRLQNSI